MYKSAKYFSESNKLSNTIEYFVYNGPKKVQDPIIEKFEYSSPKTTPIDIENNSYDDYSTTVEIKFENLKNVSTSNPNVWGPMLWFTLHNGAAKYPVKPSPLYISKMKDLITSLPYILPCISCQVHANNHIENHKNNLDDICSSREKVFKFFVDFHNSVNRRTNKKEMSYEDAFKMYNGKVNINKMNYT